MRNQKKVCYWSIINKKKGGRGESEPPTMRLYISLSHVKALRLHSQSNKKPLKGFH